MGTDSGKRPSTPAETHHSASLRRQAEERIHANDSARDLPRTNEETQRLVHELEVHQIELEMQNTELTQAREEVDASLDKYTDLYDFAPVGYITLSRDGIIHSANLIFAALIGIERSRMADQRFGQFIVDGDSLLFSDFLGKVFASRRKECCEVSLTRAGNSPLLVQIEAIALTTGEECRVAVIDITERKQAEQALRISEERHRLLAETMMQGVVHQDVTGMIISMNPAAERILGKNCEEFLGSSSIKQEYHTIYEDGEPFPGLEHPSMVALRTGLPVHGVIMGVYNPHLKEYRWLIIDGIPLYRAGEPRPSEVYSVFEDITERKRADEELRRSAAALQASEQRMQQALQVSRSFTFEWQPATDQVLRSASCASILGLSGDAVCLDTGVNFFQRVHPDDGERFIQTLAHLKPGADTYTTDYRVVRDDGSIVVLEETGQAHFDSTDKLQQVVGVTTDVTARKQVEEELQKAHNELELRVRERTEELAVTVNTLQSEIIERERAEGSLQQLNRLYAVLSETNQAIVRAVERDSLFRDVCRIAVDHGGFMLSWIGLVDETSDKVRIHAAHGAVAYLDKIRISDHHDPAGSGPTGIALREGTYYICNDFQNDPCTRPWHEQAKTHGIQASASIALKQEGQVIGAFTLYAGEKNFFDLQHTELLRQMGVDISFALDNLVGETRRQKAEQALLRATAERLKTLEELREKDYMLLQQSRLAAMGEMIGNIAHQWRQPLNTLGLTIQDLTLSWEVGDFSEELLKSRVNQAMQVISHMSQTIDDFRNFFRPDKQKEPFKVSRVISNALSLIGGSYKNLQIRVEVDLGTDPTITGYPNEFAQVLLNILNNARDALLAKAPAEPTITIALQDAAASTVVTIRDNGGGIPEGILDKIFDPYFSTKGPDQGTGLGLFMAKTIIETNMGGTLTVRNAGDGAEFRMEV